MRCPTASTLVVLAWVLCASVAVHGAPGLGDDPPSASASLAGLDEEDMPPPPHVVFLSPTHTLDDAINGTDVLAVLLEKPLTTDAKDGEEDEDGGHFRFSFYVSSIGLRKQKGVIDFAVLRVEDNAADFKALLEKNPDPLLELPCVVVVKRDQYRLDPKHSAMFYQLQQDELPEQLPRVLHAMVGPDVATIVTEDDLRSKLFHPYSENVLLTLWSDDPAHRTLFEQFAPTHRTLVPFTAVNASVLNTSWAARYNPEGGHVVAFVVDPHTNPAMGFRAVTFNFGAMSAPGGDETGSAADDENSSSSVSSSIEPGRLGPLFPPRTPEADRFGDWIGEAASWRRYRRRRRGRHHHHDTAVTEVVVLRQESCDAPTKPGDTVVVAMEGRSDMDHSLQFETGPDGIEVTIGQSLTIPRVLHRALLRMCPGDSRSVHISPSDDHGHMGEMFVVDLISIERRRLPNSATLYEDDEEYDAEEDEEMTDEALRQQQRDEMEAQIKEDIEWVEFLHEDENDAAAAATGQHQGQGGGQQVHVPTTATPKRTKVVKKKVKIRTNKKRNQTPSAHTEAKTESQPEL